MSDNIETSILERLAELVKEVEALRVKGGVVAGNKSGGSAVGVEGAAVAEGVDGTIAGEKSGGGVVEVDGGVVDEGKLAVVSKEVAFKEKNDGQDGEVDEGVDWQVSDTSSWSDEMNENAGRRGVEKRQVMVGFEEGAGIKVPRSKVDVSFGGADLGAQRSVIGSGERFFTDFVNTDEVRTFVKFVERLSGEKVPKAGRGELALVRYTSATVPVEFVNGRSRLRGLAHVGDAAMNVVLVNAVFGSGDPVSNAQETKNRYLSKVALAAACEKSGLMVHLVFATGVVREGSRTAAEAVEALAGWLYRWRPAGALVAFMRAIGLKA